MPPRYDRIAAISPYPNDLAELTDAINRLVQQINDVFTEMAVADSQYRGRDGYRPTFENRINAGGFRISNAVRSRNPDDVVIREELEEIGLLGNPDGISISKPVNFTGGVTSTPSQGGGGSDLATITDVIDQVTALIEESVALAVSGQRVFGRDYGRTGTTQGQLGMAQGGDGRADFLQQRNGNLLVEQPNVCDLLTEILRELRRINNVVDD